MNPSPSERALVYGGDGAIMNLYVPESVAENPAVVVSLHYCTGKGENALSWFRSAADQFGFIVIAPDLPETDSDGCWDVGSTETQTHDGGSHSQAIAQMVDHVIAHHGANPDRIYAASASSGAMLTNVLLGAYPDVFSAGAVLAGVPFGCWTAADGWTSACANGSTVLTEEEWGDKVRAAYPEYSGPRPRVQLFHGTADEILDYANLNETVEQWKNVLAPLTAQDPVADSPKTGWTETSYLDASGNVMLEVFVGEGVDHDLSSQSLWPQVLRFFQLTESSAPGWPHLARQCSCGSSSVTVTATSSEIAEPSTVRVR